MAIASQEKQQTTGAQWEKYRSLYELFRETATREGDRVALRAKKGSSDYNVSVTWRQLADTARIIAAALIELGLKPGERTAIASPNRPEWVMMDLGTFAAGAADVPLYPTLTADQMAYILNDSGARVLAVVNEAMLKKIMEVEDKIPVEHVIVFDPTEVRPKRLKYHSWDDLVKLGKEQLSTHEKELQARFDGMKQENLCSIVYTSGTTGEPKGAMLTHRCFLSNALCAIKFINITHDDVELSFLPLCHVFERIVYYCVIAQGAQIVYAESIDAVRKNMGEVHPTIVPSVPRLFEKFHAGIMEKVEAGYRTRRRIFMASINIGRRYHELKLHGKVVPPLLALQYNLAQKIAFKPIHELTGGRIKFFLSGGAPLRRDIGEFFLACGIPVIEGYGLTETSPVITVNPLERPKFGTVGQPIGGVEVKIAEDGEIICRGPNVMQGYFNKPQQTREAIDPDGWFHTGDIGMFDSDGYLVITDRKKELLVLSNGKKVAPQPIEGELKKSSFIEQAMVLGDDRNFVGALIVPAFEALKRWAQSEDLGTLEREQLLAHPKVKQLYESEIEKVNKNLAQFEKIKQFVLLPEEFSQDKNELTPTLKFKRKVILEHYKTQVDQLYAATAGHA
ncbi:MAG: AMP-dependent synthetase/ligase [Candidatus Xenobia bacterium]